MLGEGQALLRECGAGDVADQAFEFVVLVGLSGHTGMQGEAGDCRDPRRGFVGGGQGLEREDLAALVRAEGNAVGDGVAKELVCWVARCFAYVEIALLSIAFQQSLAFEGARDAVSDRMQERGQLGCRGHGSGREPIGSPRLLSAA